MIRACTYIADKGGAGHLRTLWPAETLNQKSRKIEVDVVPNFVSPNDIAKYDVVCFHRQCTDMQFQFWEKYKNKVKRVYMIDGGMFNVDAKTNIAAHNYFTKELLANALIMMKTADMVVVDNDAMKEDLITELGIPANKIRIVLSSYPDTWNINPENYTNSKPRILFSASMCSYIREFGWLYPLIAKTAHKYEWILQGSWERVKGVDHSIDGVMYVPWNDDIDTVISKGHNLKPDIGVCPKIDTKFNKLRGSNKSMECTMLGIPAIGSKYDDWKDPSCPLCVPMDYVAWEKTIDDLMCDTTFYDSTVKKQKKILDRRWLSTYYKTWEKLFCDVVKI